MVVVRTPVRNDNRFNGLQDARSLPGDAMSLTLPCDTIKANNLKQEVANATNPNCEAVQEVHSEGGECLAQGQNNSPPQTPRSKWTDANHAALPPSQQPQQQAPQNQQLLYQKNQEQMWKEMQRRDNPRQQPPSNLPLLQHNPGTQSQKTNPPVGQVGNGLPQNASKQVKQQFEAKNSPMLVNAASADLQQNSMANGLLQNQQRHQTALDNSWSGQAPPADGPDEWQHQYEVIRPSVPGKPPQFIIRNNANVPMGQELQGFPPQRSPPRYFQGQPGGMMMQPGMMSPGMGGMMQPMSPRMAQGMPPMMGQGMPQGMPQGMLPPQMMQMPAEYMPQAQSAQPVNSYPYGYANNNYANHAYQPSYPTSHGMHGQGANMCQNYS